MKKNNLIQKSNRIVIKIGSALLIDKNKGALKNKWLESLALDICDLIKLKKEVVVVSSGSIALGKKQLALNSNLTLDEKQAAAATGQISLAHAWKEVMQEHGLNVAQILLAPDDTETRRKHLNARATLIKLLELGVIPVINENDTVSTEEIKFGDNDRLAARVAQMCSADLLILLSDINGLYSSDPNKNKNSTLIGEITEISREIESMAGPAHSKISSGGMITKIEAAKISMNAGCHMIICDGRLNNPLLKLQDSHTVFSWFKAKDNPLNLRKQWISGALQVKGKITIDDGATKAIKKGYSILPAGILSTEGDYEKGDLIKIVDQSKTFIGTGLTHFNNSEVELIKGSKSENIETILGYRGKDEVVHRDDLVLEKK
ncbi:MAG: glutamate 5-kinase [Alphaproteobacteria bacterium]|jgi:glutamate 5-kinase|nr:glutamate 5-kinase [Alphaproteobacteria bacterium]MDB2584159.1 glutamate 5-kinase [Alphaproteobacteria bacterium]